MIEEFENRKKTKNELKKFSQHPVKKEFNIKDFENDYKKFIEELKNNNKKDETI